MKFTEARLEALFGELLARQGYACCRGDALPSRAATDVLLRDDLRDYLSRRYAKDGITVGEIDAVVRQLDGFSSADLYASNKAIMQMVSDGFLLKREDRTKKDLYVELVDYRGLTEAHLPPTETLTMIVAEEPTQAYGGTTNNIYRFVNQVEIVGYEKRIPDGILYINGLPLVVFEFKSAIREDATIHDAYVQLTTRYRRDIPELFKYNAFCVISDGVNTKAGSFFAPYEFFYAWRKINPGDTMEKDGIDSLQTLTDGMLNPHRLRDIVRNFIYFPDSSQKEAKILCRYPQYYAAGKLFENILRHRKPVGDGKGGTYFGATGCGKSFTMLFLTRLLMKSVALSSPTIILITDRTDLDDQLSAQFTNAKRYIGDDCVVSVESRKELREYLRGRNSGGVFLTTIHKFTEDTELLTERSNVICISDEAHRSQVNLEQKITVTEAGVRRTFGFATYLHKSLPNATYVGFTGTPINATLDVFGSIVDAYTMTESVKDEITVRIVYEGRAAKVLLDNGKLKDIEDYYARCAEEGSSEYQIEESKRANAQMALILGDPGRITALAEDFVKHYETRVTEGSTICGKAMFVSSNRQTAFDFYKAVIALRPEWNEIKACESGATLSERERKEILPMERIKLVMTRAQDDPKELYNLLGTKEYRKELDRQFKKEKSNFKIAIVVDMWLTGFDVPCLDTIYIDKPVQRHNLIQTISRVNRKCGEKHKGLVVDYIGIKRQMNLALAHYAKADTGNFEDVEQSVVVVRDQLALLKALFHTFDISPYFTGTPIVQLECLNRAVEFVQLTQELEKRFMFLVKRLKAAYDICSGGDAFAQQERDLIHFYIAVRSILFKLTKGDAPDIAQMNARVREMIHNALQSDGVEEILKAGEASNTEIDLFSDDYLEKISKIKLPNTKLKLLQHLLMKAIDEFKQVNKFKGIDFAEKFKSIVEHYNERKEDSILVGGVLEDFIDEIIDLFHALQRERENLPDGIDFEEKAFYDILKGLAVKYDFTYPEDKLIVLAKAVKLVVDDKTRFTDWSARDDIKAELKVALILLLAKHKYPPVDRDEVYKEIFEQAENFKKYRANLK